MEKWRKGGARVWQRMEILTRLKVKGKGEREHQYFLDWVDAGPQAAYEIRLVFRKSRIKSCPHRQS